jgi:hypothetical protein
LANSVSLDAVVVGLLWMTVFTVQFCRRLPSVNEMAIIGLSIWLVYTVDRLFDSLRLDHQRPHSLRHRFHFRHRKILSVVWFLALAIDTALIVLFASESQLRWGCSAIAIVVAYVCGVQLTRHPVPWFPKELQAGMAFAFGVSLTAWSECGRQDFVALLLSTLLAGMLFTTNCYAIACWERDLDSDQRFSSWVTEFPESGRWLPAALIGQMILVSFLIAFGLLPWFTGLCLTASELLLFSLVMKDRELTDPSSRLNQSTVLAGRFALLADAALVVPPAALMAVGVIS